MLSLEGNPLVLTPQYKEVTVERLEHLKMFDAITIFREPKEPVPHGTPVPVVRAKDKMTLDIHFRLLKDIEGIYLIPDYNCPFDSEKLDELNVE